MSHSGCESARLHKTLAMQRLRHLKPLALKVGPAMPNRPKRFRLLLRGASMRARGNSFQNNPVTVG